MMVLFKRYWLQLTADRRKFGALCGVLCVALLLWARLIVVSNMPRTAVADEDDPEPASERPVTKATSDNGSDAPVRVALQSHPDRDPFVVSDNHFPKPTQVGALAPEAEKSLAQQTEDPEQAEALYRARLQALVNQLTLDAAMSSASLAVIGGRTFQAGGKVPAQDGGQTVFTLAEVRKRSVILEFKGRRFELEMSNSGV